MGSMVDLASLAYRDAGTGVGRAAISGSDAQRMAAEAIRLAPGAPAPSILRQLDASQMQLGGLAARLRSGGTWQVLAHAGWIQTATDWPRHAGLELTELGLAAPDLHGSIFLERGQQYLHLGVDLQLGNNPTWSLRELRKVKFNEKNYFDHPGFGVIAIVSPVRRAVP